jgi:membrane protein YqaA with SNARE-associated domain
MKSIAAALLAFFWGLGGFGLLILGVMDSSFLFAPLGNDILMVAMTARQENVWRMVYYAAMSTAGSILGCLLVDMLFRKLGEKGLEKHLSRRRLDYVKGKVTNNAAWALAFAAIAPPPFPFTPFVMAAAALQYPRKRLLAIVGAVMARTRPGIAALLLIAAAMVVGLVAPGVIPGIADSIVVFFGYLVGAILIAAAACLAVLNRSRAPANAAS